MATPDTSNLTSSTQVFTTYTLPQIRQIHKSLHVQIDEKAARLRTQVGNSYRELLGTADTIVQMRQDMTRTQNILGEMGGRCGRTVVGGKITGLARFQGLDDAEAEMGCVARVKLLEACGLAVGKLLRGAGGAAGGRGERLVLAAKVLVLSRLLISSFGDMGELNEELRAAVEAAKKNLGSLRRRLLRGVEKVLGRISDNPEQADILKALCAYSLASSSGARDALRHFLNVRGEAMAFEFDVEEYEKTRGTENVLQGLDLYTRTLLDVQSIVPSKLSDALASLKKNPLLADESLRTLEGLKLDIYEKWCGDEVQVIKNDPPLSTLLAQADEIYTLPSVLTEIRDEATRSRVQTQLLPFLKLRSPRPESVQFVQGFARRTGDLEVLSKPDIHLIALAYELECEKNGGDWRLRKEPGQKQTNGKSPAAIAKERQEKEGTAEGEADNSTSADTPAASTPTPDAPAKSEEPVVGQEEVSHKLDTLSLAETTTENTSTDNAPADAVAEDEEEDDEEGWITPSNLKKHQAKDQVSMPEQPIQRVLQVALLTSDFAMQNVILRINLNLLSPSMARITRVKTWVLRCHGCFQVTRQMDKQFCPRCGQPTLTRVSATTDSGGNFTVHLKKNFQFNKRGNVYSIPKPVHGTANSKYRGQGGGKGGWGTELLLAEDQKEYAQKVTENHRMRTKDLMDEDYLPGILTGNRQSSGGAGRPRVGAGRAINSKKRNG